MNQTLVICKSLIRTGLLETFRRKEAWVVIFLTILMTFGAYTFTFFGVSGLDIFVKDMALTAVGLFTTIIGSVIATRQIPDDISRRTIFPILSRPITRDQYVIARAIAAFVMTSLCFVMMTTVVTLLLAALKLTFGLIFLQYIWLKLMAVMWLSAFGVFLSVTLSQSAAFTMCFVLALGSGAFSRTLLLTVGEGNPVVNWVITFLYGFLPHYALFDTTGKVIYGWKPIPAMIVVSLTIYAISITAFWLFLATRKFRGQSL
jgi:ABC-type transport system involved in multi-copper enzyme maturation permease subunit